MSAERPMPPPDERGSESPSDPGEERVEAERGPRTSHAIDLKRALGKTALSVAGSIFGFKSLHDVPVYLQDKLYLTRRERDRLKEGWHDTPRTAGEPAATADTAPTPEASPVAPDMGRLYGDLETKIRSSERLSPEKQEQLLTRLSEVRAKHEAAETRIHEAERAEIFETLDTFVTHRVSGLTAAKETLNTVLVASGMRAVRGVMYAGFAAAGRVERTKQQAVERGETLTRSQLVRDLFVTSTKDTFNGLTFRGEGGKERKTLNFIRAAGNVARFAGIGGLAVNEVMHGGVGGVADLALQRIGEFQHSPWESARTGLERLSMGVVTPFLPESAETTVREQLDRVLHLGGSHNVDLAGAVEHGAAEGHGETYLTPEEHALAAAQEADRAKILELAKIGKGEGIAHAVQRQIEFHPKEFGCPDEVIAKGPEAVHRFAGEEAARILIQDNYIRDGAETRTLFDAAHPSSYVVNPLDKTITVMNPHEYTWHPPAPEAPTASEVPPVVEFPRPPDVPQDVWDQAVAKMVAENAGMQSHLHSLADLRARDEALLKELDARGGWGTVHTHVTDAGAVVDEHDPDSFSETVSRTHDAMGNEVAVLQDCAKDYVSDVLHPVTYGLELPHAAATETVPADAHHGVTETAGQGTADAAHPSTETASAAHGEEVVTPPEAQPIETVAFDGGQLSFVRDASGHVINVQSYDYEPVYEDDLARETVNGMLPENWEETVRSATVNASQEAFYDVWVRTIAENGEGYLAAIKQLQSEGHTEEADFLRHELTSLMRATENSLHHHELFVREKLPADIAEKLGSHSPEVEHAAAVSHEPVATHAASETTVPEGVQPAAPEATGDAAAPTGPELTPAMAAELHKAGLEQIAPHTYDFGNGKIEFRTDLHGTMIRAELLDWAQPDISSAEQIVRNTEEYVQRLLEANEKLHTAGLTKESAVVEASIERLVRMTDEQFPANPFDRAHLPPSLVEQLKNP